MNSSRGINRCEKCISWRRECVVTSNSA